MTRYYLALGTNLGDRKAHLNRALAELGALGRVSHVSPCYETPPLLPPGAPPEWYSFFLNAVVILESEKKPQELLQATQKIETLLGREVPHAKWSPRHLDIDILFTDPWIAMTARDLTLPHPDWAARSFVVAPLMNLPVSPTLSPSPLSAHRSLLKGAPALMAALNATPDSFSGPQGSIDVSALITQMDELLNSHIAFLDVGAESTRPGATPLSAEEEWQRLEPLLDHWRSERAKHPFVRLSLDTYHAKTAARALDYKVDVLNDVSHLSDPAMRELAPHFESVILMHSLTVPADRSRTLPQDQDVVAFLRRWIRDKLETLKLAPNSVIFDPGLGFGKTPLQSLEIIERIEEFADLPVRRLVGHSRKSFMIHLTDSKPQDRDIETLGLSLAMASRGVEILRVHNISWHERALKAWAAGRGTTP